MFTKEIPHPFLWSVSANLYSQMYTNSSKIIKLTLKYTSNTENLVKMIFAWHNVRKTVNSNNDNEVV